MVIDNTIAHPVESVRNVWMHRVHTLKGWYDETKGETDVAVLQCFDFIAYWNKGPFLTLQKARPTWCPTPLVWLFPPTIT